MINHQAKPEPLGLVLSLIGHKLFYDVLAELLLGECACTLRALLLGAYYPLELAEILHCKVSPVGPLEKVVYDPDFLGVCNCETLARMNGEGVAKSPVLSPLAVEDLAGIFQGHLDDVVQDELLLAWPAIQQGPRDGDHDVLPMSVFWAV